MQTLGETIIFRRGDEERVKQLTIDLYELKPWVPHNRPLRLKDKIRAAFFDVLRGKRESVHFPLDPSDIKNVLIFRYDALGDYIITTTVIDWLLLANPDVNIDVIGSYRNQGLLKADPRLRDVIAINSAHAPRPSWLRIKALARRQKYDVVVATVFTRMTKAAILTSFISKNALTITVKHEDRQTIYGKIFDCQVEHPMPEHWALTIARFGPEIVKIPNRSSTDLLRPRIALDGRAVDVVRAWCAEHGCQWSLRPTANTLLPDTSLEAIDGRPLIIVNISAFSDNRQWSSEACARVLRGTAEKLPHCTFLLTSSPAEKKRAKWIVNTVGMENVQHWTGSILEYIALIAGSSLMLSPDTATVHIASVFGVPCVVLFAELIKVAEWYPLDVEYRAILSADPESINAIPTATVVDTTVNMFNTLYPQEHP